MAKRDFLSLFPFGNLVIWSVPFDNAAGPSNRQGVSGGLVNRLKPIVSRPETTIAAWPG